jgi:TonB family protein
MVGSRQALALAITTSLVVMGTAAAAQGLKKITDVAPVYPEEARRARVEGTVQLRIQIGTDGRVTDARVIRSIPQLDQAALDAVRQWVYDASRLRRPLSLRVAVPFVLPKTTAPAASVLDTSLRPLAVESTAPPDVPSGVYVGEYVCGNRPMQFALTIVPTGPTTLDGRFAFAPFGAPLDPPAGAYRLRGTWTPASGRIQFDVGTWEKNPGGYVAAALIGAYDRVSRTLSGQLVGPGCQPFKASFDASATERAVTAAAAVERALDAAPTAFRPIRNAPEQCVALAKWSARLEREYTDAVERLTYDVLRDRALNLFDDESFVPVYGKPFDEMTPAERRAFAAARRECYRHPSLSREQQSLQMALDSAFAVDTARPGSFSGPDVASVVAYRRKLRAELGGLVQELERLTDGGDGLRQALAIQSERAPAYASLWPSERRTLTASLDRALARLAAPALERWADQQASGSGPAAIASIAKALSVVTAAKAPPAAARAPVRTPVPAPAAARNPADPALLVSLVGPEARERVATRLRERRTQLVADVAADARRALSTFGTGVAALRAGTRWYAELMLTVGASVADRAVVEAVGALEARRSGDIDAGAAALTNEIAKAGSGDQVRAIVAGALGVPSDRVHPRAAPVFDAASRRARQLDTAAAQAEREARSARNACANAATGDRKVAGEPSSRDLCLAIAAEVDELNDRFETMAARCKAGGFDGNPVLAVQCLSLCGGTRGTCDASVALTGARKVACEKAAGRPGYSCDYSLEYRLGPMVTSPLPAAGGIVNGIFVETPAGWIRMRDP